MLNLDLTDEQNMLRDMVRGICEKHCSVDVVRDLEDDPHGVASELWNQMGELGICGLMIPESLGGSDMGVAEGVIVEGEIGRSLAPVPYLGSCVLSAGAIIAAGSDQQRQDLLPGIASGDLIIAPAWLEPGNGFSPAGVQTTATANDNDFVLTGSKLHVEFASAAQLLLVLARTGDDIDAIDLFLVDPTTPGVELSQKMSISSNTQYRVDLHDVQLPESARVGDRSTGWSTWNAVMERGAILSAARAVGGASHSLEITVEYAKTREQFDKPLGAFQSISHYLADAKTRLDGAKVLVDEAAWAADTGLPLDRLAPMAKTTGCHVFRDITAMAQQVFGGVGFTVDFDIQLYFRRAKQLQLSWWDTRECELRIAAAILD